MSYLDLYLKGTKIRKEVQDFKKALPKSGFKFSHIAVTGISGILIGSAVAAEMGMHLIVLRKTVETTHSDELIEGLPYNKKVLLLDDFMETGTTIENLYESINDVSKNKVVGTYFYKSSRGFEKSFSKKGFHTWEQVEGRIS